MGKTALVVEAAYRCWEFNHGVSTSETPYFDAIIFTEAKKNQLLPQGILPGKQVGITLEEIFREIANTFEDQSIIQTKPEEQEERVKKKLEEQNTLLIVDNFETIENQEEVLRFLNELPRCAKGVITTRETVAGYSSIYLDSLPEEDSIQLIQQQAQEKRVRVTEKECQQIYERFGGVPVALIYAVGQLASRYPLDTLLDQKVPLPEDVGRYCFESSVKLLRGTSLHLLLMSLAIFPKPPVKEAIAEVAGLQQNGSQVRQGLAQLLQLSLISQNKERYTMLPLTREYALDELAGNPDFQEEARERWVNWYIGFAKKYGGPDLYNWTNYYKLEEEEDNLREVLRWCHRKGSYEKVRDLWQLLYHYTSLYGYWHDRLEGLEWVIQESEKRGEWSTFVEFTIYQSWTLIRFKSEENLTAAEKILAEAEGWENHVKLQIRSKLAETRAKLYIRKEQYDKAREQLELEFKLVEEAQLEEREHIHYSIPVSYHRAEICFREEDYKKSKEIFHQTMASAKRIKWYRVINSIKNWLADLAIIQGDLEEAHNLLTEGITVAAKNKNLRREARYKSSFARLEKGRGNLERAQKWAEEALQQFRSLAMDKKVAGMENEAEEMEKLIKELEDELQNNTSL